MPSKENMKSLHKDSLKKNSTHSYNLRPRCKRINYNNTNSYRSNIKGRLQTLQRDLAETSNRKKAYDSSVVEGDAPAEMVTHFVNGNFDNDSPVEDPKAEELWLQNYEDSFLQSFNKSDCSSDDSVCIKDEKRLAYSGEGNNAYTVNPAKKHIEMEEEKSDGFQEVQASDHSEQAMIFNNWVHTGSASSHEAEENEEVNVLSEQENLSHNGEDTMTASSCEAEENEENNEDVNNTEFQRNYSVSAFNYQELAGNPTMLHLTRWASESRIQNNIDPLNNIGYIDIQAMGDGLHNQPRVLEFQVAILNEEDDESDRASEF